MSKKYRDAIKKNAGKALSKEQMREFSARPGRTFEDGSIMYTTEQAHKATCDVNNIIRKYDKTGLILHVSRFEAQYGDMTGLDFKTAQDLVLNAQASFDELPSNIRKYFNNSPMELLTFMEDPNNREKAIELGLINPLWTPESDGLGEHVKEGENKVLTDPNPTP